MPFKNKAVRARACCRIRNCRDFHKKGKRKPTCHFPSSVYSLPSLGVFTFRIVLNRILHKSSLLAPMESRRTRRPTFTAEERLERRREQDRRRHAESQLLIHYQKFFVEWICWRINIFLKSCSRSKKLQPGGKPNSFAFRNPGRPRRSINCSRDGSRTASRFAIQVNRDGRSNCSQLGSRPSPANKPCLCRGDSRRSSGQTRRRSASDGCRKGRCQRDLILLTMWVLSPTIVVIFVQCIDCFGWDFWLMGCCPQISPCLYH